MANILRTTVPAIAAGLILAGCGGSNAVTAAKPSVSTPATSSSTATATTADSSSAKPRGSKVVVDKENGYQIAVPSGYTRITSKSQLSKISKDGASLSGLSQQLLNKQLKLMAIDPDANRSINVVVTAAGGLTADQLPEAEPVLKKSVEKLGAQGVTFKKTTLGDEPALRATYTLKAQGRKATTVQYITVHDDLAYTLTFTYSASVSRKIENQTAGSWRFLQTDSQ